MYISMHRPFQAYNYHIFAYLISNIRRTSVSESIRVCMNTARKVSNGHFLFPFIFPIGSSAFSMKLLTSMSG